MRRRLSGDEPVMLRPEPNRLYVIARADSGEVKIGISSNVEGRLAEIQAHHGEPLTVLLDIPGGRDEERALHERFDAHRKRGEWFCDCPEIREWIASVRGGA